MYVFHLIYLYFFGISWLACSQLDLDFFLKMGTIVYSDFSFTILDRVHIQLTHSRFEPYI